MDNDKTKLVTYDLCAPGRDYTELYKRLKAYKESVPIMQSTWIISTPDSCAAVCANLSEVMDANDKLLVDVLTPVFEYRNILGTSTVK